MVAKLLPPEAVVPTTQMTPQALFHMKPGSLSHRFMGADERSRDENDERPRQPERCGISAGRLVKRMPSSAASRATQGGYQEQCGENGWLHVLHRDGPTWSPRVRRIRLSAAWVDPAVLNFSRLAAQWTQCGAITGLPSAPRNT